jgi:hypothetical protein
MTRHPDWLALLNAWVDANRSRVYAWGDWDCVTAAADCVRTITGEDVLAGLEWDSARSALRVIEAEGGLSAAVSARLGEPIPVAFAQRGDVVLIVDESVTVTPEGAVAVCLGETAAAPTATGMGFQPMSLAVAAWRVGRG